MARNTHRIYASSASDGKHPDEKIFGVSYYRSDANYDVDVIFDIPDNVKSYVLKTWNMTAISHYYSNYSMLCLNGDIGCLVKGDPISNNDYYIVSENGLLSANGDTTKKLTQKQLSFNLSWYAQDDYVFFHGVNADNEDDRPNIEIETITPTISDFSVEGSSIDATIVCTWSMEDVETFIVQAIQEGSVVATQSGTTENSCTFQVGTFSKSGTTIFKIIAETDGTTVESSQVVELTQTVPQIISIEPNGILKLLTNPIDIEFTGTNITSFVMNVYQNNINKFTFSGTTERKATVIANVFSSGTVTIEIVAKYVCAYYETSTTRSVTFTAYGPPPNPILNIESTYNTPFPLIKWSSSEQLSYQIKIDTLDTGEIYSNDKMYQVTEALTNYTYYAVSLRIKNQYNLWSEWVTSTIYIDFAELSQPEFNIYADIDQACIVINIQSPEDVNFCYHEVYRRESNVWVKIATNIERICEYKDFACASNITYDYKVRAITTVGGYTDSVIKEMQCNFKGNILSVPFTDVTFNVIHSKEETGIQKSTSLLVDRKFVVYCGCEKPKETRGLTKYRQFSLSTTFKTLEEYLEFEKLTSERVVLFRDNKGTKAYCSLAITGITDEKTFYATVDLSLTEVYYKEGDYSEAESRPLRFIDEEW